MGGLTGGTNTGQMPAEWWRSRPEQELARRGEGSMGRRLQAGGIGRSAGAGRSRAAGVLRHVCALLLWVCLVLALAGGVPGAGRALAAEPGADSAQTRPLAMAEILAAAPATDWRSLDPENTLYLDLDAGRVVIELAPAFAPGHVAAMRGMARAEAGERAITRVQGNFVTQWRRTRAGGRARSCGGHSRDGARAGWRTRHQPRAGQARAPLAADQRRSSPAAGGVHPQRGGSPLHPPAGWRRVRARGRVRGGNARRP